MSSYRRILLIIGIVSFSVMFAISVVGPLLNELAIIEGVPLGKDPNSTIGIIFALGGFTLAAFQIPFAKLSERVGKRKLIIIGCLIVGVSILLIGYVRPLSNFLRLENLSIYGWGESTILLAILRIIQGVGAAATWPLLMAIISISFPEDMMGIAMGIFGMSFGLGMSLGPVVGPALVAKINIYSPFILAFILSILACGITVMLPEAKGTIRREMKFIMDPKLISLSLIAFTLLYAMGSIVVIYPRYIRVNLGLEVSCVAITMAAAALSYTFLQPLTGKITDKVDKRKMIVFGLPIFAIASSCLGYANSSLQIYTLALIFGIAAAFVFPASNALLGIISPKGIESIYSGLHNMMLSLGVTISPIIVGILADVFNYKLAYLSILILSIITLAYFLMQYSKFE